jgi:hypothetical protein
MDEFLPACSVKRRKQVLNDYCVMQIRLGRRQGYIDSFLRARSYRRRGLFPRDVCLCPCRFEYLLGHRRLCGSFMYL